MQRWRAVSDSVASGSNLRLSTIVVVRPIASVKCAKPQEWNSGAAIIVRSPALSGICSSSAATGSSDCGWRRLAPFGLPVVPEVRISALPCSAGGSRSDGVAAGDQVVDRAVGPVASGSCQAMKRLRPAVAPSISSANSSSKITATGSSRSRDVGQLRAGEGGIEEQRVRPELVDRDVGLDPAAVVAAHDRHAVARADALGAQRVGERVRALVDLRERQRPGLVDQREAVGMARCGGLVAGGRCGAPADQCAQGVVQAVGPLRAQDPRARERRDGLGLAGDEGGARELHARRVCHPFGSASPDGTAPVSISRWMSAARRGLRNTWRWPTDGFSASSPASSSASPTACASAAVVAGEAACEVREVGVVAAPLPHAVEPLEDPAGDAQGRVGIGVRGHAAVRARLQQREHGVLVLLDRALVRGAAAEPRDRLGDPQRVPRTDRRP